MKSEAIKVGDISNKEGEKVDNGIKIFRYLRPFLIKLLMHSILIYLSIRAYYSYESTAQTIEKFKDKLTDKVVIDIKIKDYEKDCDLGYESMKPVYFPAVSDGCRCQFQIFPKNVCSIFKENNFTGQDFDKVSNKCDILDKSISSKRLSSGFFRNLNSPMFYRCN